MLPTLRLSSKLYVSLYRLTSLSKSLTCKYPGLANRTQDELQLLPFQKEHEQDIPNVQSIEEPEADSLAGRDSETYGNRIHTCLITFHSYKSVRELLEAFRDAIAGHRSLLEDGKTLYGDISENNIIITAPAAQGDPKGRLIDMDLGKELNSMPSGTSHRTGTMQFMAIEVLQGKAHTYRHGLESFFYVFI